MIHVSQSAKHDTCLACETWYHVPQFFFAEHDIMLRMRDMYHVSHARHVSCFAIAKHDTCFANCETWYMSRNQNLYLLKTNFCYSLLVLCAPPPCTRTRNLMHNPQRSCFSSQNISWGSILVLGVSRLFMRHQKLKGFSAEKIPVGDKNRHLSWQKIIFPF